MYNADKNPFANEDSKTVLGTDGSSILWSPKDEISVFYDGDGMKFTGINSTPKAKTIFMSSGMFLYGGTETSGPEKDYLYGVYPYSSTNKQNGDKITLTVPSSQIARAGSFSCGAFPSIGRSKTTDIAFYNVCGGFCLKVSNKDVRKVVIKSNGGESLAGIVKVAFDGDGHPAISEVVSGVDSVILNSVKPFSTDSLYYVSLLPTVLSSGFTISFHTGDSKALKSSTKSIEIKRSVFGNLGVADSGLKYNEVIASVDLGLSVKWASCNMGASSPDKYGRYFAWGDIMGQTWNGSSWSGGGFWTCPECEVDANNNLKFAYDVAQVNLGGDWRMPTKSEFEELIDNCTCTWTDNYNSTGVPGWIFISKKTGYTNKSIFFPAAGVGGDGTLDGTGSWCICWSSTFFSRDYAWCLSLYSTDPVIMESLGRKYGFTIRPVIAKATAVSSVSLSTNSTNVYIGWASQLAATVNPSNATDKSIKWSSSNESVATVSPDGFVTGVSAGTATITATTVDGGYTATCSITVKGTSLYVDLGLSVKWASFNIGATKPEEYGRYFAYGDVKGDTWNGSSWSGNGFCTLPSCNVDYSNNLKPEYDAAHVILGGNWRMPTTAEFEELKNNCSCTWTSNYYSTGVAGRIFTSKKTGYTSKSIFLPAAGAGLGSSLNKTGSDGIYWSSTLSNDDNAYCFDFYSNGVSSYCTTRRDSGLPIRPVTE